MVFQGRLGHSKYSQISRTLLSILADLNNVVIWMVLFLPLISRTLLSILADLNNTVIWMVSILHLISNSSSLSSKPFGTIPSASITIGITVTLSFYDSLVRSKNLFIISLSFIFPLWSAGRAKSTTRQVLFFFC